MAQINDGGNAFAAGNADCMQEGMSLRDWFAGQALIGMLACEGYVKPHGEPRLASEVFADCAYEIADAMLKERAK